MARKKRGSSEINASSMADIAFLLLIFFLVTTTFDRDQGIQRKLPQKIDDEITAESKRRNVFLVFINKNDQLLVNGTLGDIELLKEDVKEFILNPDNKPNLPEFRTEVIDILGEVKISKGVVSLQSDRGTSYNTYIEVQDVLARAFRELREERALKEFGVTYTQLKKMHEKGNEGAGQRAKAIEEVIPISISEAKPKETTI